MMMISSIFLLTTMTTMVVFAASELAFTKNAKFASFSTWAANNQKEFASNQAKEQRFLKFFLC